MVGRLQGERGVSILEDIVDTDRNFATFHRRVLALLEPTAAGKGYNATGVDGANQLYEFVEATVGGPGHAIGEAIYKIKRYAAKRNPEDLEKLAAWAFLIWRHHK
jgi:hypothetical protein